MKGFWVEKIEIFPTETVAEETAAAQPTQTKVLKGEDIKFHPDYGGERGGFIKRFFNAMRGKDYIWSLC